jgi:Holliday junction resolvase-like predicted endonuclease
MSMMKKNILGITRIDVKGRNQAGITYYISGYRAIVQSKGKIRSKFFSIAKYGEDEALRLAIKARKEFISKDYAFKNVVDSIKEKSLSILINEVENLKSANEKGRALEELLARLFSSLKGFSVLQRNIKTATEEIDLIILNSSNDPRFSKESAIILVECKNWSKKCDKTEFVVFKEKILNRGNRCSLGFLISWNGFKQTVTKEMLRGSREGALIVPIEGKEIKQAVQNNCFWEVLLDAWIRAITL